MPWRDWVRTVEVEPSLYAADFSRLGEEWPQFAHAARPEFLLTLPHRDHTSGFFIARLRSSAA